ncbi:tyrosine-type recombinase/integrase [Prosthecobacter sp.]|uniref:tyrosine-type recombinase/integrase n=1 Tax=Prosthecobacter sp. TaxID=1965333 RepID=UPI0037836594
MASIRPRGKGGAYYALFRDAAGKLRERPTKTTDKKLAQKLADEWERAARPTEGERTAERMQRVMSEIHHDITGSELTRMTAKEFAKRWLGTREKEISPHSFFVYKAAIESFLESLGDRAEKDIHVLGREDVLKWRDEVGTKRSARTANHRLKILRMWLGAADDDGWIQRNIAKGIKPLKTGDKNVKRPFTVAELRLILSKATPEWKAMIIRGYYTGQRLGDIASLRVGDEDPHARQVSLVTIKTGARVIIDMHPSYVDFVLGENTSDDPKAPLHPLAFASITKNKGRVVTLSEQFAELLVECGLRVTKPGKADAKTFYPLSFHSLRHSFVSHLQDAGVSRSIVQDIVGHESAAVNATYTHLDRTTKSNAVAKLPDITKI